MRRTSPGLRAGGGARVGSLAAERPEFKRWLELLDRVEQRMSDPVWAAAAGAIEPSQPTGQAGTPLLDGAEVALPAGVAGGWVRDLLARAQREDGSSMGRTLGDRAALRLLEAVLADEDDTLLSLCATLDVERSMLRAISEFALMPLLTACAGVLRSRASGWTHPYCCVCGAWPTLVEIRGLDRDRKARCGRCGSGWHNRWLRCIYCGESDHRELGYLAGEEERETKRVETCRTCHGFLKVVTTLSPASTAGLWVRDLETLELDIAAVERDYARPDRPGRPVWVRFVDPAHVPRSPGPPH